MREWLTAWLQCSLRAGLPWPLLVKMRDRQVEAFLLPLTVEEISGLQGIEDEAFDTNLETGIISMWMSS